MSDVFECFVAGQDKLSSLLKTLPGYTPTASQEAAFAAAAHAAQSASAQRPAHFEPSDRLKTDFRTRAAQLEIEAVAQRKTILKQIEAGDHPDQILRNRMHPATTRWLRAQAALARRQRAMRIRQIKRSILDAFSWSILGRTALAGVLAAMVTHWLISLAPSPTEVAFLEAFQSEDMIFAQPRPDVPQNQVSARSSRRAPRAAPQPAPASSSRETDPEPDMSAQSADSTPSPDMAAPRSALLAAPSAPEEIPRLDSEPTRKARIAETHASAIPALTGSIPHQAFVSPQTMSAPLPAPAMATNSESISANIQESPAAVARRLPQRPAGLVWQIRSPTPAPGGLQDWLDALSRAMPEAGRPARFNVISDLPPGSDLRIFPPFP